MRVAQILLEGASAYERKCQRLDASWLEAREVLTDQTEVADVIHVYGPDPLPRSALAELRAPIVANASPPRRRLWFRRSPEPARLVTPLRESPGSYLPEAVEDEYFSGDWVPPQGPPFRIGSIRRRRALTLIDQTMVRLARFRDDVEWIPFDALPPVQELLRLSLWMDPTADDDDYDGGVAEALASGLPVVAARTPINQQRLDKGQSGLLPPKGDFNEMTHAILAALFKPEVRDAKRAAARQTLSKFRRQNRGRALERTYQDLVG